MVLWFFNKENRKVAKNQKDSLTKNTILLSIGTLMTKGLSFIMVPFFSRWLTAEDYGTFDLLCTYVTLLIPLIGLASNEACFRFSMDAKSREEKATYISNSLAIYTINTILLFAILLFCRTVVGWEMALYFFVLAVGEIYNMCLRGYLRAIKHLDIYSFVSAITTVFVAVFVTLFVKFGGMGLRGIILGYGFGYILGDMAIVVFTKYWSYLDRKKISYNGMKELVSYSYALIPNSIAWWFINVSDRTIIQIFLGAVSNGIYAIAYKIPNILSSVFSVFSVSWQQSATESVNDDNRDRYFSEVYNKMVATLLTLCCGILSLNSWLFNYIFDNKYYVGHLYAPILIGGTVFATISQFYGSIQISLKQPKENGITTVIGAVSNVIIHLVLVRFIGLYAAAISTIVSEIIVCILRIQRLKKSVTLTLSGQSICYFAVYLVFTGLAYYITNPIVNVISVIVASILVVYANKNFIHKFVRKIKKK